MKILLSNHNCDSAMTNGYYDERIFRRSNLIIKCSTTTINLNWPLLWNLSVTIDWWFFDKKYFSEPTSRTCWSDRWSIWSPKESICPCCVDRGWLAKAWGLNSAESMSMEFIILSIEGPSQWARPYICKFEKQHILTGCFVLCPFRGQNKYCPNVH